MLNYFSMDLALKLTKTKETPQSAEEKEFLLIAGCLREERWAQKQLYETYYGKLLGVCLRYSNNSEDARDILNEGYVKVFRYLERYKVGTSLECWMRRIMINTSIDYYRKEMRHRSDDIEAAQYKIAEDNDVVSNYSAQEILKVIQVLPPAYRAVFNLYAIEGYSHKEVAESLGITESTSRSNLVKARVKLKELLTELGIV
jgi:RNA polymerase sigma-70 factor (ECF subfamily)